MSRTRPHARRARQRLASAPAAERVRRTLIDALLHLNFADAADEPALTVERAPQPSAPERLAREQTDAPGMREALAATYRRCLDTYRSEVRRQDREEAVDDLGAALAFFVAANLHALHGVDPDQATLERLERQLRGTARRHCAWNAAPLAARQFFFEKMAILGVLMAGACANARAQGPDALARVRQVARGYLQQTLGLDPELLTLDANGLSARPLATA